MKQASQVRVGTDHLGHIARFETSHTVFLQGASGSDSSDGSTLALAEKGEIVFEHFEAVFNGDGLRCSDEFLHRETVRVSRVESVSVGEMVLVHSVLKPLAVPAVWIHTASGRTLIQGFTGVDGWDDAFALFEAVRALVSET